MKKITVIAALFALMQGNAQVMSETFDTALNWTSAKLSGTSTNAGWTRVTTGTNPSIATYAGAGMAKFASYDILAGNVYALTSPTFNLDGTKSYSFKFAMYRDNVYATDADNVAVHVTPTAATAPSAATLIGTVHRSNTLAPAVTTPGWYVYQFNIPAGTAGANFIRLVATSQYGNNTFVDNVSVQELLSNDLALESAVIAPIILTGSSNTITGTIKNYGSNVVNSAVINYQVNGGTIYSQNLTGLNLASGASYNYSHNTAWVPTAGNYSVKVWVSDPNGSTDANLTDNETTKAIKVATNQTARKPILEKFTSATCGPCANYNANLFTPFYNANSSTINLINYQVNWPGAGDPYYTAETGVRRTFYSVSGAPTLYIDAKTATAGNTAALTAEVNGVAATPAYFGMTATKNLVGNVMNVEVTTTPYLTGTYRLHVAVIEKTTTGNVASNGETSFKNVMMKMMPDANGTVLNCVADTPITTNLSVDLTSTFKEADFATDHEVIVFVQDHATKQMMNSFTATQLMANESFEVAKINVYPNPSNGVFTVDTTLATDVKVLDITGKEIYRASNVTNQTSLNLTNFAKGVYMLKMKNELGEQTEKVIIK